MKSEEAEIKHALAKVGLEVDSIYDLVNTKKPYPEAIPVLLELLRRPFSNARIKEGIIRALTVKEAKGKAAPALLGQFTKTSDPLLRWAIGNAISVVAIRSDLGEITKLVENSDFGDSRQMLVITLGKMGTNDCEDVLLRLLKNGELIGHVIWSLGNLKSTNAKENILPYLTDSNIWIRKEAANAIKKIDGRTQNSFRS